MTKELGIDLAGVTVDPDNDMENVQLEIPPEWIKESVDKVTLWLNSNKGNVQVIFSPFLIILLLHCCQKSKKNYNLILMNSKQQILTISVTLRKLKI